MCVGAEHLHILLSFHVPQGPEYTKNFLEALYTFLSALHWHFKSNAQVFTQKISSSYLTHTNRQLQLISPSPWCCAPMEIEVSCSTFFKE